MIALRRLLPLPTALLLLVLVTPALARRAPAPAPSSAPVPLASAYRADAERLIGAALTSDRAYRRLSELCDDFGPRPNGSATLDRAIEWLAGAMREDGLENVRLEPVLVPHWDRGVEHAWILEPGPRPLAILGLGRSVGTPPGGLVADVVAVSSFAALDSLPDDAVRGRIVLYDVPFAGYGPTVRYRFAGASRAAARGAVGMLLRSITGTALANLHTGVMGYVDSLPKIPAAAVSVEDAQMIHRLLARGERVRVRVEMGARTLPDTISANVMAEVRGRERPDEVVVVGGHTDSWDVGEGAMDDGGGCIVAWEAVRLIHELGLRPRRTVRCALWVNEESGTRGGNAYADSLGARVSGHVAAIESDMGVERPVGFDVSVPRPDGAAQDTLRTARAAALLRQLAPLLAGLGADRVREGGGGTDIDPLAHHGVPVLGLRTVGEHYFDWHHSPADMLDKVDPVELRRNVAALAVLVYVLADMPGTLAGAPAP